MQETTIILAERYAKAVIELAMATGDTDLVGDQLAEVAAVCLSDGKARGFWRTHKVPADEKRHTLQDILEQMDATALVRNTVNLLLDRGRFDLLPEIVKAYRLRARELSGVAEVTVTSAFELGADRQEELRDGLARMTGKTVLVKAQEDRELIGGVRIRVGNLVIDGSVRGRLRALGRTFA